MQSVRTPRVRVRPAADGDETAVRRMRSAYHLATEREKGSPVDDAGMTTLRLSVWEWRTGALDLYRRAGFLDCPSWDPQPGLVCLECRAD